MECLVDWGPQLLLCLALHLHLTLELRGQGWHFWADCIHLIIIYKLQVISQRDQAPQHCKPCRPWRTGCTLQSVSSAPDFTHRRAVIKTETSTGAKGKYIRP